MVGVAFLPRHRRECAPAYTIAGSADDRPVASEPEATQRIARGAGAPLDHLGEHAVDPALAPQDADLDDELRERLARADGQPVPLLRVARLIGGERALRLARNGAHLVQQMPLGAGGDGAAPSGHDRVLDRPLLA